MSQLPSQYETTDADVGGDDEEASCRRFREAWQKGDRPRLEDYLKAHSDDSRAALLSSLIQIDMDYRRRHGETPDLEEYAQRFAGAVEPSAIATNSLADASSAVEQTGLWETKSGPAVHSLRCPNCQNPLPGEHQKGKAILCPACGGSCRIEPMHSASTVAELRVLGRFQLMDSVGQGAFGAVWRARDTQLDRIVALKIPHSSLLSSNDYLQRFQREARSAAQLRHPGIVRLYEVAVIDGTPVLVSDFIEGVPLKDFLEVRRLTVKEAAGLVADVADALHYAHSMGLVHRDIKPANIMLERPRGESSSRVVGKPIVVDFGLAVREEAEIVMTVEGQIVGTPAYMSPEQAAGKSHDVDGRSDVYSLGVVLYELICGELPFRGSKAMIINQVVSEEPRPPRRINDNVPRDLETVCLKALAKQPARRFATAGEFADELRRFLRGEPIHARPVGRPERIVRWSQRNPAIASLIGTVAVVLVAGIITTSYYALLAIKGERDAIGYARQADLNAELANHRYYAAETNLIQQALLQGKINLVQQKLQALKPQGSGDPDLRSFEWSFLDCACHTELRTLRGHEGAVWSVACSPDRRGLASAGNDGVIRLWDIATGRELQQLKGHRGTVWCVVYSPDGKSLASIGADQTLRMWTLDDGRERWSVPTTQLQETTGLAFSPDGQRLAAPSDAQSVKIRDAKTGRELLTLPTGSQGSYNCVVFSPDGKRLASISNRVLSVWDVQSKKELFHVQTPSLQFTVAFSPDGQRLATGGDGITVHVWDAANGRESLALPGHFSHVRGLAFSPDSRRLTSCSLDRTVRTWDLRSGREINTFLGHLDAVFSVAFDRDGWRLISGSRDGTIKIWESVSDLRCLTLQGSEIVFSLAFSPNGSRLASGGQDMTVRVWDVDQGIERFCLYGHVAGVSKVAFSPDGRLLASASKAHIQHGSVFPGEIKIWDAANGRELRTIANHPGEIRSLAFARDGRLASAEADGTVRFWDPSTGNLLTTIQVSEKPVRNVAFSPDGTFFAISSSAVGQESVDVSLWDASSGQELARLATLPAAVTHLAFSHNSQLLAGASADQTVHIWDLTTREEKRVLRGHNKLVYQAVFSSDDRRIVSTSIDTTIKIWDIVTGMEMLSVSAHDGGVVGLAFSPDGRRLASSGVDRLIKLWDAEPRTPENIDQREALSLVEYLFNEKLPTGELSSRVRTDPGISEAVRRRALAIAEPYVQSRRGQAAFTEVWGKIGSGWPKQVILEDIRNNKTFTEQLRRDALSLVEQFPENIRYIHWWARLTAARAKLPTTEYSLALRQAEAASQAEPANATYLTTLGMAQYRMAKFAEALSSLARSASLHRSASSAADAANVAFQAMANFRLGKNEATLKALDELRALMQLSDNAKEKVNQELFREAEELIVQKKPPGEPAASKVP